MAKDSKERKEKDDPVVELKQNLSEAKQVIEDADDQQDAMMAGLGASASSSAAPTDQTRQGDQTSDSAVPTSPTNDGGNQDDQAFGSEEPPVQGGDEGV